MIASPDDQAVAPDPMVDEQAKPKAAPDPPIKASSAPAQAPPPASLILADLTAYQAPLAEWPLPLNPPFMESRELDLLTADLKNYVRGRVRGRSYLIAGHRGAGKTALVSRAIDRLTSEIMRDSVLENPRDLPEGPVQRPLLVKLHGPTMLEPSPGPPAPAAAKAPAGPLSSNAGADPDAGKAAEQSAPEAPQEVVPGVHAALVQTTLGLYRALAGEATTGFRAHALYGAEKTPNDQAELAAQLALDLDGGATPAALRAYWAGLDRLEGGVFWPATADPTCVGHGMIDQGLREIAALATAAQAFQVCTGRISYEAKTSESAARKQVSELKGAADLKDALNRFGTLGLGALTGISLTAADATPVAALAAGLGVWLLGSFSVSWARSTERNANRSVDYSFIRDNSLATLERDLPVVITRVRDAGLVPVFVIDELDKVDNAPKALSNLISRLKHLIADFGFFCFLVNRDCFDEIEARIRSRAYPAEHTLFSERLLLRPYPAYALRYLMDLVQGDMHDPQFALARTTFALNVMHHAQLNLTDMMRRLARAAKPPSSAIGTAAELTEPRKLVIATVQVAIDETLRSPVLAARMEEDSGFAQLAIDTLYDPSRSWAQNVRDIDPSKETLKRHLEQRMRSDAVCGDGRAGGDPGPGPAIESGDLEMLQKHLVMFLDLLGDLSGLRTRLGNRTALGAAGDPKPGDIRLADIPPADVQRICERLDNGFYRFLFYRDGDPVVEDPGHLNEQGRARAELLIPYAEAFEKLLATIGLSFDDVARTPLLRTVSGPLITRSRTRLAGALRRGGLDPDVSQYLSTLERFHAEIAEQRGKLGELLILIATLKRDVGNKLPVMPAIERLIPFDLSPEEWLRGWSGAGSHEFPLDAQGLESWTSDYPSWLPAPQGARLPPPPDGTTDRSPDDYQALAEPLIRYFSGARGADFLPVDYHFLLEAVRGRLPAAAMHSKFSDLTTGDWSRLAFAAAPRASRDTSANQEPLAPYWVFAAALRGLGFGKSALRELGNTEVASDLQSIGWAVESPGMTADHCLKLVRRLEATARERPSGLLVVETDEDRFGHEKPIERRPTLIIDRAELDDYLPVLNWLDAVGILTGQARGLAADTDDGEI